MPNPIQSAWHQLGYAFDRAFKTGKRRHEFETKYTQHGDYFGYQTKPYELEKYRRTLALALEWRRGRASALELGCSVGVFTAMIAKEFGEVTAVDIAAKALVLAEQQVAGAGKVTYVQSDLISLNLKKTFDVIFCAEVLYYIPERDAENAVRALEAHLAPHGLLIEVSPQDREAGRPKFFHGWDRVLGSRLARVHVAKVDDPLRPYEVLGFAPRG